MLRFSKETEEQIKNLLLQWSVKWGVSDRDIASNLGVTPGTVGNWRRRCAIKPSEKFKQHFKRKYGIDAVVDFRECLLAKESYASIGRLFGFSRERARQIARDHFTEITSDDSAAQ